MARKTKEEAEKTRKQLLAAGLGLFASKGFAETSVEEVASAAGLTKGALYWHFNSKAELLRGILEEWRNAFRAKIETCDFDKTTREDFLNGMAKWAMDIAGTKAHRLFYVLMWRKVDWGDREVRPIREWLVKEEFGPAYVVRHVLASFAKRGLIPADYDEQACLNLLLALWHGLLMGRMMIERRVNFKEAVRNGLEVVLSGIENGKVRIAEGRKA